MTFNPQPSIQGAGLKLRPLMQSDQAALYAAANDPELWAGHPAKNRWQEDVFAPYFAMLLASHETLAILDEVRDTVIGCSRYYVAPDRPQDISIGFTFLAREYWGGTTNRAVKKLMLEHAFKSFSTVWFHIDPANIRSQKATAKLGAVFSHEATIGISGAPGRWMCFALNRKDWEA